MKVAWVFPGQGAQRRGMGAELFDRFPDLCGTADAILGYSVRSLCLEDAPPGLRDTRSVQPALFVVGALGYLARAQDGPGPDVVAGHSLGEYPALFAAGSFDFATGVRLVRRRGELMAAASGGMLAVTGIDPAEVVELLRHAGLAELDVASHNCADQVVSSGPERPLRAAAEVIGGDRCVPLRVSAPFHSRYLAAAAARFSAFLDTVELRPPRLPVISNVTARPYPPDGVRELLARQITSPVLWWESMSHLVRCGVREVVEIGPGRVLTGLWESAQRRPCPPLQSASVPPPAPTPDRRHRVTADRLGSADFRRDYGVRYAYLSGSMFKAIASTALVIRMARAGLMGFFGTGGLTIEEVEAALRELRAELGPDGQFGMNLLATPDEPALERELVASYLDHDVRYIEAASYTRVTAGLVRFRFTGAHRDPAGRPRAARHVIAKVSRPEVATVFMAPPPTAVLEALVAEGALTAAEAEVARELPVAGDLCVEADSGGHTDAGNPYTLMPAMTRLRDQRMAAHGYPWRIRIGAAGGLGSPEAVAAAFLLGADFVITGSVNQCTAEAATSDAVKDLLVSLDVQDTTYAPAGDMFELGARVQVVRKSTLFPARANKLFQLYRQVDGLDSIDVGTRQTIEQRYLRRSFNEAWEEMRRHMRKTPGREIERAENSAKVQMALVFRWYFMDTTRLALAGAPEGAVNYQIHCGPAMGAFNRVVAGTPLHDWRARHPDTIAELLMTGAAEYLDAALHHWASEEQP